MKNENRIIDLIAEMVTGHRLTAEVSELENESITHNLQIADNSRAVLKLADESGSLLNTKGELVNSNSQYSNDH
jgi:hypothetical protein